MPGVEGAVSEDAVIGSSEKMPTVSEEFVNCCVDGLELLGRGSRFESLYPTLVSSGRLTRVLGSVVLISTSAVGHGRNDPSDLTS